MWETWEVCSGDVVSAARFVCADILLLLSLVMNLLAEYSLSSSLSCTLVYGTRFFLPRRPELSPPDTVSVDKH
ncbi:hypothetical protein EYF80_011412 [Liparis tanakae]|uniref:Uncharacterized protein n=1 Tax=Liparis tanakae TaxID=230148 RepID=A0A4Z2IL36_9TELE|nr:hypothetical protein EYF80_011412 [Liparis tanakae]